MGSRRVLLIKPGSMGDVIHALPVASAIRQAWPESELTWIVDPRWAPLLSGNPVVSATKHFPREDFRGAGGWARALRWYAGLRGLKPDVVVDLQGLLRSALMAGCSGGKTIVGLADAREGGRFFYSRSAATVPVEHAVRRYLRVLPMLGIDVPEACAFPLPAGEPPSLPDGFVVLHPFARGAGKSLGAEAIRGFVSGFRSRSSACLVIVGRGEVPAGLPDGVVDLCGKTPLEGLVGILRAARFVVSVDSGPMHLAAAVGTPLLGIHTWSDPRLVGPFSEEDWIWQGGEIRRQNFTREPLVQREFTPDSAAAVARFAAEQVG